MQGAQMKGVLITGTDTGAGKTIVCGHLAAYLRKEGLNVITQKWVQTGCEGFSGDVSVHMRIAGLDVDEHSELHLLLCPYTFSFPASPHLAARREGVRVDPERIKSAYRELCGKYELVLVEGIGGLNVPITEDLLLADLAADLKLSAVVVVANRLGCINHSLLTVEALRARNIPILGLIFNRTDNTGDKEILDDNPRIVESITGIKLLGELPYMDNPMDGAAKIGDWLDLPLIKKSIQEVE